MSTWQGTGAPAALVNGTLTTFPHVDQGGRKDEWVPEVDESWITLDGEVIEGDRRFRFRGEYTWSALTDAQVKALIQWHNQRQRFQWRLHSDVTVLSPWCRVVSVDPASGAVEAHQNVVTVVIESVGLYDSIPVPDLTIIGQGWPRKGIHA